MSTSPKTCDEATPTQNRRRIDRSKPVASPSPCTQAGTAGGSAPPPSSKQVRRRHAAGETIQALCDAYGVSWTAIRAVLPAEDF